MTNTKPLWNSNDPVYRWGVWLWGFVECLGDAGMTWEHDHGLSEAYDAGRDAGRKLCRVEESQVNGALEFGDGT